MIVIDVYGILWWLGVGALGLGAFGAVVKILEMAVETLRAVVDGIGWVADTLWAGVVALIGRVTR